MSFLAKLVLGSAEFNVLSADYEISQPTDSQNRPNGKPKGGIINLTVEASNKNDLAEWMLSPTMKKAGQLTFYRRDANSSMKTISFSDAFCVNYKEVFVANGDDPMKTLIRISAGELKINNSTVAVTNPWSSMASRIQDVGEKLGLNSIMEGPGGAVSDLVGDIGSNATIQEIGQNAKEGYNTVSHHAAQAYDTGKQMHQEAKETRDDAKAMRDESREKIAETKKDVDEKRNDAENEITSFLP
jgi:hypothetical protein